eukprot:TRINITY_DN790_c0_g1_i1.p1 TRINITY_DN790_c0_g1~~TRINITY_DN790_c0_g1_i1.p1  ORF type:complete len:654 (+),score=184.19 TRINITY_DN790_c0_g1_i1:49-2010(+)
MDSVKFAESPKNLKKRPLLSPVREYSPSKKQKQTHPSKSHHSVEILENPFFESGNSKNPNNSPGDYKTSPTKFLSSFRVLSHSTDRKTNHLFGYEELKEIPEIGTLDSGKKRKNGYVIKKIKKNLPEPEERGDDEKVNEKRALWNELRKATALLPAVDLEGEMVVNLEYQLEEVLPLVTTKSTEWICEEGDDFGGFPSSLVCGLDHPQRDSQWYSKYFVSEDHFNFHGTTEVTNSPVIISVLSGVSYTSTLGTATNDPKNPFLQVLRFLIITVQKTFKYLIHLEVKKKPLKITKQLIKEIVIPALCTNAKFPLDIRKYLPDTPKHTGSLIRTISEQSSEVTRTPKRPTAVNRSSSLLITQDDKNTNTPKENKSMVLKERNTVEKKRIEGREWESARTPLQGRQQTNELGKLVGAKLKGIKVLHEKEKMAAVMKAIEAQEEPDKLKVGVLYVKGRQTNEDDIFSNSCNSKEYLFFLGQLGTRIQLKDWNHFSGGLDVNGKNGEYSYHTNFSGYEIMFHVCTELPLNVEDPQQVERKKHIGNDVVVVVYFDRPADKNIEYLAETVVSHFNHVIIVVTPADVGREVPSFFVQYARKEGVMPFGPLSPRVPLKVSGYDLRDFLLCKVINAEFAAYAAPTFKNKFIQARKALLQSLDS